MESLDESEVLAVSVYVHSELRAGAELSRRPLKEHEAIDRVISGLLVVYPHERFASVISRGCRDSASSGTEAELDPHFPVQSARVFR
jgi:hypothetical protein